MSGRTPRDGDGNGSHSGRSSRVRPGTRAQLSLPAIEAGIGVVLVLGLVGLLAVGTPTPPPSDPQLDAYAADVATVLAEEPPRHEGTTRLDEVTRSEPAFDREADALEDRVDHLLPDNLMFRIETPHGPVGFSRPDGIVTGVETVTTQHGEVRVEVWYA